MGLRADAEEGRNEGHDISVYLFICVLTCLSRITMLARRISDRCTGISSSIDIALSTVGM